MSYNSLTQLISNSTGTRRYFLSLPVELQLELHKYNDYIHCDKDLHDTVEVLNRSAHYDNICDYPHEYSLY